jgi:hypothetical protein
MVFDCNVLRNTNDTKVRKRSNNVSPYEYLPKNDAAAAVPRPSYFVTDLY